VVTGSNDVDEIYHRMAVIRRDLHTNVSESVAGAEAVVDWGRYTWTYPWIALGAAAARERKLKNEGKTKKRREGGREGWEFNNGTVIKQEEEVRRKWWRRT